MDQYDKAKNEYQKTIKINADFAPPLFIKSRLRTMIVLFTLFLHYLPNSLQIVST